MAKIFGGSASRLEVYALFVAAVVLIGGGVAGAVVVTSSDSKPAEVAQVSVDTTVVDTTVVDTTSTQAAAGTSAPPASTSQPKQQSVGGSTNPTITVPGLTAEQAETLRQQIQRQQEADAAAAEAAAYAATHPVGRVRDVLYTTCNGYPNSLLRWVYLGEYPAPNGIQVTVNYNGRSSTGSPNAMSGDASHKSFTLAYEFAPTPGALVTYEITTTGREGSIRGTIMPTVVDCDGFVE